MLGNIVFAGVVMEGREKWVTLYRNSRNSMLLDTLMVVDFYKESLHVSSVGCGKSLVDDI
jgi:hypothetical protein